MAYQWTPFTDPPATAPWIDDPTDFAAPTNLITALPTWHVQIPSNADACRIIPIGIGAEDGTLRALTIYGINFGLSSTSPGGGLAVANGLVQALCVCSSPMLGSSAAAIESGYGKTVEMLLCSALGALTVADYYKDLDRAFGLAMFDGTDDIFTLRKIENEDYSEIIIGNLNGFTHIGASLSGGTLAASGTVTEFNLLVSFRIQS